MVRCNSDTPVTRDVQDFAGLTLDLINPWDAE
jgi:hypothetical protein